MMRFPKRIYCRREPDGRLNFSETLLGFRGRKETIAVYLLDGNEELVNIKGEEVSKQVSGDR